MVPIALCIYIFKQADLAHITCTVVCSIATLLYMIHICVTKSMAPSLEKLPKCVVRLQLQLEPSG
jgi:hypothetical protein